MAWQMPAPGQWSPAMGMPQDMNIGNYSPEQWALMQQQNWQQWAQWQQQYSHWQTQFGEEYTQHLQTGQPHDMPPLPVGIQAPAPPPPDQPPPPPPPHENNQPLFGSSINQASVAATQRNTANFPNTNSASGNNQWSYNKDTSKEAQSAVNSDALKKLAEEEKSFDIQFQKWEEEIDRWRKENVNHPDKKSYKEYEDRFELCRAQLLERRQQMNTKRARLLNITPQAANTTSGNTQILPPPPPPNSSKNNYNKGINSQNYKNNTHQQNYNVQLSHNRNNNKNIDPQDRYESYQDMESGHCPPQTQDSYSNAISDPTTFLQSGSSSKGIPGLDLVPEPSHTQRHQEIVDITDDPTVVQPAPDYSTISKGINNILGDEKIMNILSMVQANVNTAPNLLPTHIPLYSANNQNYPPNQGNRNPSLIQDNRNPSSFGQDQQYGNKPNMPYNRQGPNFPMQQNQNRHTSYSQPQDMYDDGEGNQYMDRNAPHGGPNRGGPDIRQGGPNMRQGGFDIRPSENMRQGGPDVRQGGPDMRFGSPDMRQGGPNMRPSGPDTRQGGPNMRQVGPNMQQGRADMQPGGSNMQLSLLQDVNRPGQGNQPSLDNGSIPPLMSLPRRPIQPDIVVQPNANEYYGPERPMRENNLLNQPPRPKWVEEPLFTPSLVVDYEHKPLRLKAREFIEPVHTFDYNHRSKDEDLNSKKKDFEKEVEELFTRKPRRDNEADRFEKDLYHRDYERRAPKQELREMRDVRDMRDSREDYRESRDDFRDRTRDRPRDSSRDDFERRRPDDRFDDRRRDETRDFRRDDRRDDRREDRREDRRDDRDRLPRRDDFRERERDRDSYRATNRDDRNRDIRRDDSKNWSSSKEVYTRKRSLSKENEVSITSKKSKDDKKLTVMIDDLLEPPGRSMRPEKIVIILRGLPGSGKSYLAKLIRDREAEHGGTARIMSIDDYFMQEGETEEKDPQTGKVVKKPFLKYEYDEGLEETYMTSLKRAFKRSLTDGYFSFLIYDAVNDQLKSYADIWNYARQHGFQVYICTMEHDLQTCFKRNIHHRKLEDLEVLKSRFFETPAHHIRLDATTLLQSASITEVQMEDVEDDVIMEDVQEEEVESVFTSKWEKMDDAAKLARLDGTSKPLRASQLSMEDYLQLDEWKPNTAKPGKKTVRWADIEESREQEKIRAIGFVVGQTDWNRMTDPTMGSGALTQTKYIERVRRD